MEKVVVAAVEVEVEDGDQGEAGVHPDGSAV